MENQPLLPFSFAKRHQVLVVALTDGSLKVFSHKAVGGVVASEIYRRSGRHYTIETLSKADFSSRLREHYSELNSNPESILSEVEGEIDLIQLADSIASKDDLLEKQDDAPIIRLINQIISEAIRQEASDIHIETFETKLVIRFRIDGVLQGIVEPNRALSALLVSRIKIMAKLDIAEKRVPQDGRISIQSGGKEIDLRVSTMPTQEGERVVLRLLEKSTDRLRLENLGMPRDIKNKFGQLIHRPHGIILVTGPTGSGKTTTLYAGLNELDCNSKNILTIEDPVEYQLSNIGQTQVNNKAGMTFAKGLRAILRQDPDVVMIGEIRDLETAQIAIQASLTGHLVLSTLHTNTAIGAVNRLIDMGVEPYLLASSLIGLEAQRLLRVLCSKCKQPKRFTKSEIHGLLPGSKHEYVDGFCAAPQGCKACQYKGYKGRTGAYEFITIDSQLLTAIHKGKDERSLYDIARRNNKTLAEHSLELVTNGITSLDEALRMVQELE